MQIGSPIGARAAHAIQATGGFTLFEIAISLLVLTVSVVSVAMVFPVGIKAQQSARFQLYAGAMVTSMIDSWTNADHSFWRQQIESELPTHNHLMGQPMDLDHMLDENAMGMLPLPIAIARRLDSPGDVIAEVLDEGGQVFYTSPMPSEIGFDTGYQAGFTGASGVVHDVPPEAQRLVFAVLGYAQQNALPAHPCLNWPYMDFYAHPAAPWEGESWNKNAWPNRPEFAALSATVSSENYAQVAGDLATIDRYLQLAQALAEAVGAAASGSPPPLPPSLPAGAWNPTDANVFPPPWKILALNYLAHAATARTRADFNPDAAQKDYAVSTYDACTQWMERYVTTSRWDWGAPRPLNRQTAGDCALVQFDLFPGGTFPPPPANNSDPDAPYLDPIYGTGDVAWKVIAAQQPVNHGRARGEYGWLTSIDNRSGTIPDNFSVIGDSWGNHQRYNLAKPFAAAERMRQIVSWAVDWQSYEDSETTPADPCDASRHFIDSRGTIVTSESKGYHPEAFLFFNQSQTKRWPEILATDADGAVRRPSYWPDMTVERAGAVNTESYRRLWLGTYGADRNGNGVLDHGPVPASTRLRAVEISRYLFYDRRILFSARN